eukprot:scaffold11421_cov67-Phaeocystis_antarctica.AAC.1
MEAGQAEFAICVIITVALAHVASASATPTSTDYRELWQHAVDISEVVGNAVHLCVRQATRPHDHLGNRKVRLLVAAVAPTVDEQRHTASAARCGANVDPVHQLQL